MPEVEYLFFGFFNRYYSKRTITRHKVGATEGSSTEGGYGYLTSSKR
jgi:hypothetical protein